VGNLEKKNTHVEIIHNDATKFDPSEGTIFFMYNPFGLKTLNRVLDNIKKSLINNPRKIRIVYYAPPGIFFYTPMNAVNWLIIDSEVGGAIIWKNK